MQKLELKSIEEYIKEINELRKSRDRNNWEIARKFSEVKTHYGERTLENVADKTGFDVTTVYKYIRIFETSQKLLNVISQEELEYLKSKLPFWVFYEVRELELKDAIDFLRKTLEKKWSIRKLREEITKWENEKFQSSERIKEKAKIEAEALKEMEEELREIVTLTPEEILLDTLKIVLSLLKKEKLYCPKCGSSKLGFLCCNISIEEALNIVKEKSEKKNKEDS